MKTLPAASIGVSLFQLLRETLGERVPFITCSKATLVHISHLLEDQVLSRQIPAMMFTGFQESGHWRKETERYKSLAAVTRQMTIFAGKPLPQEVDVTWLHVQLADDDPLRQEWLLLIVSDMFSALLCGQDKLSSARQEGLRQFDTILSFEPETINLALNALEATIERYRPERLAAIQKARAAYTIHPPKAGLLASLFTEMMQFEEKLYADVFALELEKERTRMLVNFLKDASYDFRTPLSTINTSIYLLERINEPERRQQQLGVLAAQTARLEKLVEALFTIARLDGEDGIPAQPVNINEFVATFEGRLLALLSGKRQYLIVALADDLPPARADLTELYQALRNILENACQHSAEEATIRLTTSLRDTNVVIEVSDQGTGILPDDLPRIFDRFYRGERADGSNLGLGLTIAQKIVERQGGRIEVESVPGTGSTFRVLLPVENR